MLSGKLRQVLLSFFSLFYRSRMLSYVQVGGDALKMSSLISHRKSGFVLWRESLLAFPDLVYLKSRKSQNVHFNLSDFHGH